MMKKIILILCILLSVAPLCAETTYIVDTEYGEKTVVIPDGYTEKDVLLVIAKNYYELNEEDKILKEKVDSLTTQVSSYMEENKHLRQSNSTLQEKYDSLVKKQESLNSMGFIRGFTVGYLSFVRQVTSGGVDVGVILGDSFIIKGSFSYPTLFSVGIGFVF